MILVTGTKRSGTSMWMQILVAAGFPAIGERYPRDWGQVLREANPAGFWESNLRDGIHHGTNPDPRTGSYVRPEQVRTHAVKVFIPGLVRSDLAYVDRVVVTIRHVRDYVASLRRMRRMESKHRTQPETRRPRLDPVVEWFALNFNLLADLRLRGHPHRIVTYESVVADPKRHVGSVAQWLGAPDPQAAIDSVRNELRTQNSAGDQTPLDHPLANACEFLYEALASGGHLGMAAHKALTRAHAEVLPQIQKHEDSLERVRRHRRSGPTPISLD